VFVGYIPLVYFLHHSQAESQEPKGKHAQLHSILVHSCVMLRNAKMSQRTKQRSQGDMSCEVPTGVVRPFELNGLKGIEYRLQRA
jgi:hypothetical protein